MILSFGPNISQPLRPMATAAPPTGVVSLAEFSRDRSLFDSAFALGGTGATVGLSGSATAGRIIQARAFSLDDGGATSTVWSDIATADSAGDWAGAIAVARSGSWFQAQVRLKVEPVVTAASSNRFGVGHVIAVWGQSEHARFWSDFHSQITPEALIANDMVQMFWFEGGVQVLHMTSAAPKTAAFAAMANVLIATRPGEKFAVLHHTVSGTDPRDLVDDSQTGRLWSDDLALHNFATSDGQAVGLATWSWFAAPGSLGSNYAEALFPLFSGKKLDGTPISFPATITYGSSGSYQADHWFGELYDYAKTRWVPYGPHKFDITEDMVSATVKVAGGTDTNLVNKQAARASWRSMLTNVNATMFLPSGPEPMNYVNGFADVAAGWTDQAHPAGATSDGLPAFARMTAHAALRAAGLSTWAVPRFDQCVWQASGSYVEVWSTAGAVTTTRLARSEAALPATFPYWTTVFGWQINGVPAQQTQIVAGRVRILPNAAAFVPGDTLTFGEGGSSGALNLPEDFVAQTWKNLPIVNVGAFGMNGVSVSPMPSAAVLANTLVGTPSFTVTTAGPYFVDPVAFGTNTGKLFMAMRTRIVAPVAANILAAMSGSQFKVEVMAAGTLRLSVRDSANTVLVNNITGGSVTFGSFVDIVVSVDLVARYARVWLNGVQVINASVAVNAGQFSTTTRVLSALASNTGATQVAATTEYIRFWKDATTGGTTPAGAPYKAIAGSAATVNADAWKLPSGVNAT